MFTRDKSFQLVESLFCLVEFAISDTVLLLLHSSVLAFTMNDIPAFPHMRFISFARMSICFLFFIHMFIGVWPFSIIRLLIT